MNELLTKIGNKLESIGYICGCEARCFEVFQLVSDLVRAAEHEKHEALNLQLKSIKEGLGL